MSSPDTASAGDARAELVRRWLARAGAPAPVAGPDRDAVDPPGPDLLRIWEDVLGHADVGPDDDYFALGGDSIAAVAVVSRSTAAGVPLTTHDLFELRTVRAIVEAQLARHAQLAEPPRPSGDTGGAPSPRLRLTPLQHGMLFQSLADPTGRTQVVQISARLDGEIDPGELAAACRAVVARHPALRTSVHRDGDGSWRTVHDAVAVPVHVADLRQRTAPERAAAVAEHLDRDRVDGFDLGSAPLLRFSLLRTEERVLHFVLTHHHLVLDGWSQQLVLRDVLDLYDGVPPQTPTHDAARDHLARLDERDLGSGLARWREILAGYVPAPVSPDPVGAVHDHRPAVTRTVDLGAVAAPAADLGVTPATVVYGAWSVVLGALTGADDVAVGATLAGRAGPSAAAAEHVGMFIATLPLRTRLDAWTAVPTWVRGVQHRRVELDTLAHCGLADIARCVPGTPGARSLFDTIAVVENFPEHVVDGTRSRRVAVSDVAGSVWEGYPLVLEARLQRGASALLRADATLFSEHRVAAVLAAFAAVVHRMLDTVPTGSEPVTVGDLSATARAHLVPAAATGGGSLRSARRQTAGAPVSGSPVAATPSEHRA